MFAASVGTGVALSGGMLGLRGPAGGKQAQLTVDEKGERSWITRRAPRKTSVPRLFPGSS